MPGENIETLRKEKGYSQEALAEQLNVARQTVSKWEKGRSVPDADMPERIANLFQVPAGVLLENEIPKSGTDGEEAVKQCTESRGEKHALKTVPVSAAVIILVVGISHAALFSLYKFENSPENTTAAELYCTLNGEEYSYAITYDGKYNIIEADGHQWIADHVRTEQNDANLLIAQIEAYFTDRGGTCEIIGDER